ncbi:MAG: hypothetical protein ACJAZ6_002203 [Oleispira sp.]|jgi:hypothetical protein|tara:strand:- start:4740 stop:5795 length:1056 start_codon:yes stop_codon:yes gene_type:complete
MTLIKKALLSASKLTTPKLAISALAASLFTASAFAAPTSSEEKVLCVFDPLGSAGDSYNIMKDYAIEMKGHGVDFDVKPYTDESVAMGDFLSKKCHVIAATDLRTRQYNKFAGTISALGALPSYDEVHTVLKTLSRNKAAKYLDGDKFSIIGIFPIGAGYLFTNDRKMNTVEALAGKRIATLNYQKDAIHMVNYVNSTVVPSDITNFGGKFNNGSVDICYSPAFAFSAYELYHGLGENGGIIRYPLAQLTMQLLTNTDSFDAKTRQASRNIMFSMYDKALNIVKKHEESIDEKYWVDIPAADIEKYQEMFRKNRLELKENDIYDGTLLTLMRKIRCKANAQASECTRADKE